MEEEKKVFKVPVKDKRRLAQEGDKVAEETPGVTSREDGGQVLMDESSFVEQQPVPPPGEAPGDLAFPDSASSEATSPEPQLSVDELQRLKADLDNTRKRMIREQSRALEYATKDVMKKLIPVIDHFRLAIDHGEGGSGVELALKELMEVLASEGLEEIEVAEGTPFDPQLHHALATHPDPEAQIDTVKQVHRNGFRFKEHILRAPEVLVAQPVDQEGSG